MKKQSKFKKLILSLFLGLAIVGTSTVAVPTITGSNVVLAVNDDDASIQSLKNYIATQMAQKKYYTDTGVAISGSKVYVKGELTDEFDKLKASEKDKVMSDISKFTEDKIKKDKSNNSTSNKVTVGTKSKFFQEFRKQGKANARLFGEFDSIFQPDISTATHTLRGFFPIANLIMGVSIIITFMLVFISIFFDLVIIATPVLRDELLNNGGQGRRAEMSSAKDRKSKVGMIASLASLELVKAFNQANDEGKVTSGILVFRLLQYRLVGIMVLVLFVALFTTGRLFSLFGVLGDIMIGFIT